MFQLFVPHRIFPAGHQTPKTRGKHCRVSRVRPRPAFDGVRASGHDPINVAVAIARIRRDSGLWACPGAAVARLSGPVHRAGSRAGREPATGHSLSLFSLSFRPVVAGSPFSAEPLRVLTDRQVSTFYLKRTAYCHSPFVPTFDYEARPGTKGDAHVKSAKSSLSSLHCRGGAASLQIRRGNDATPLTRERQNEQPHDRRIVRGERI